MGPRARDVLAAVTRDDVSNAAFPFGTCARDRSSRARRCARLRVTYVGELGWELHIPTEAAPAVYDALMAAGAPHGLVNAGYRAIEVAAAGKGLSRLGQRHRAGPHAARGRPRLGGEAESEHAVPRPRGDGAQRDKPLTRSALPASRSTIRRSCCWAARRSIATASASAGCRAAAGATRSASQYRLRLCAQRRGRERGLSDQRQLRAGGRHARACRRRSSSSRSTIRRWSGSRRSHRTASRPQVCHATSRARRVQPPVAQERQYIARATPIPRR